MPRREGRPRARLGRRAPTPGELYRQIAISREEFEVEEKGLVKRKLNWYVKFCKGINRSYPSFGKGAKFQEKYRQAIEFLDWDLNAAEFAAGTKFVMFASVLAALIVGTVVYVFLGELLSEFMQGMDMLLPLYIYGPPVILALFITNYIQNYPISAAKQEEVRALTYVSEIIGYMIMSIKLVPNLEKAVEFAAEHGKGKIAEDFRKLLWDVQLGVYSTLSEGLDALAYRWGNFSSEFKQALMRIRASVIENTEAKRYALLDHTMEEVLESIKNKMELYARSLSEPSVLLFYIGVLLPLILIIILPIGSTFSGAALANPLTLVLLYNVAIPALTIMLAVRVIKSRPPTYTAPVIPDSYPDLPRKNRMLLGRQEFDVRMLVGIVFVVGVLASALLSAEGIPPKSLLNDDQELEFLDTILFEGQIIPAVMPEVEMLELRGLSPDHFENGGALYNELMREYGNDPDAEAGVMAKLAYEKQIFFMQPENDVTPMVLIFGVLLTIAASVFVYLYFMNIYKRKVQLDVMQMESEFKESIYVIASRMGENKPIEDALKHARDFLPNYRISQTIYARTVDNISLLGMPLESAIFDPNYGSLKYNPSSIIRGTMRLMIDSVQLGVNVAARTMMSLSMQLTNADKVNNMLRALVSDITGTMRSMATFIAPVVLGITTGLQKIVVLTISSISTSNVFSAQEGFGETAAALPGLPSGFGSSLQLDIFANTEVIGQLATPTQFVFIVALYIIELVIVMTYFTSKIQEDNDLMVKLNIAKALPISMLVFVVSMFATNILLGGFLGGG